MVALLSLIYDEFEYLISGWGRGRYCRVDLDYRIHRRLKFMKNNMNCFFRDIRLPCSVTLEHD